jgi:hypothetical protein
MSIPHTLHYEWKVVHDGVGKTPNLRTSSSSWLYNNCLWLVCGESSGVGKASEVWKFDLKSKLWSKVDVSSTDPTPNGRDGQASAYIGNGKFCIFGGQGFPEPNQKLGKESDQLKTQTYWKREVYNDLWVFDCNTLKWSPIYPDGLQFPMGRRGSTAVYIKYLSNNPSYQQPVFSNKRNNRMLADDTSLADSLSKQSSMLSSTQLSKSVAGLPQQPSMTTNQKAPSRLGSSRNGITNSTASLLTPEETLASSLVLENCLVIYGGAGIELSKYTEQVYNDLWVFSFDRNVWIRMESKGATEPLPTTDHRAYRFQDNMIVIGGIVDTTPKAMGKGAKDQFDDNKVTPSDIQVLNLQTMTWSHLSLTDTTTAPSGSSVFNNINHSNNSSAKLNLHGFTIIPEKGFCTPPLGNPKDTPPVPPLVAFSQLILFGGNPVVDTKAAISSKTSALKEKTSQEATLSLNVEDGLLTSMVVKGEVFPEARYGHMMISSTPCNYEFENNENAPKESDLALNPAALLAQQNNKGQNSRKSFAPLNMDLRTEEVIGYVFGGSNLEIGGYCDPILYSLMRVKTIDPNYLRSSSAPTNTANTTTTSPTKSENRKHNSSHSSHHSTHSSHNHNHNSAQNTARNVLSMPSIQSEGSPGGDDHHNHESFSPIPFLGGNSSFYENGMGSMSKYDDLKTSNIWASIQNKINISNGSYKNKTIPEPNNWEQFKLSLTPSHSEKTLEAAKLRSYNESLVIANNPSNTKNNNKTAKDSFGKSSRSVSRPGTRSGRSTAKDTALTTLKDSKALPFLMKYNNQSHADIDSRMSQSQLLLEYQKKTHK